MFLDDPLESWRQHAARHRRHQSYFDRSFDSKTEHPHGAAGGSVGAKNINAMVVVTICRRRAHAPACAPNEELYPKAVPQFWDMLGNTRLCRVFPSRRSRKRSLFIDC